jgi:hypothetical protein
MVRVVSITRRTWSQSLDILLTKVVVVRICFKAPLEITGNMALCRYVQGGRTRRPDYWMIEPSNGKVLSVCSTEASYRNPLFKM